MSAGAAGPGHGVPVPPALTPGQTVQVRYTKWGGRPHWAYDSVFLGADEHGVWLAGAAGTRMARPGAVVDTEVDHVQCFALEHGSAATFWADRGDPGHAAIYVDIATVPVWSGLDTAVAQVTLVDLDLDVVRTYDPRLLVDDEDEFAEHQVAYGYPAEVIAAAERECRSVYAAVECGAEPYATVGWAWLARFGDHRAR